MTAPRVCPDPWTSIEDAVCEQFASHHVAPLDFAGRLFIASTILTAGAIGAAFVWLVLKLTGWLQP